MIGNVLREAATAAESGYETILGRLQETRVEIPKMQKLRSCSLAPVHHLPDVLFKAYGMD